MPDHRTTAASQTCQICGKAMSASKLIPASLVRPPVSETIAREFPSWSTDGYICHADLNRYRSDYIRSLLKQEKGELSSLERAVVDSIAHQDTLANDVDAEFTKDRAFGQRLADRIAEFGGSWTFIATFVVVMAAWMAINVYVLADRPFDPYPFILLNLVLSCLAALQAPIIMMSQNRQEMRDRLRSQSDYRVNLKAELEIRHLHEKIDYLLLHQWQRLMEIQEIQIELINELSDKRR